jgi:Na+:H+ antiporter
VLGNARTLGTAIGLAAPVALDDTVRGFHRQMTFIVKSFFFVFIGAMLGPPWEFVIFGVFLGGVLYLARVPSVWFALLGSGFSRAEKSLVTASLPRGMAAGVLATLPVAAGVPGTEGLPVLFAARFPMARRSMQKAILAAPIASAEAALPAPRQAELLHGGPAVTDSKSEPNGSD